MVLDIEGLPRDATGKAIRFFCSELDISPKHIAVYLTDEDDSPNGACYHVDDGEFMIWVKCADRSITEMFLSLAHELVHVKQFIKDGLDVEFDSSVDYKERWWEIEAFELETTLLKKFVDSL